MEIKKVVVIGSGTMGSGIILSRIRKHYYPNSNVGWSKRAVKSNNYGSSNMLNHNVYFNSS